MEPEWMLEKASIQFIYMCEIAVNRIFENRTNIRKNLVR